MKAKSNRNRRGIALIWLAVTAFILVAMLGMAVDAGFALLVKHQLQNAADSASLAGAQLVREDANAARDQAKLFGEKNFAASDAVQLDDNFDNLENGDIVIGFYNRHERLFIPSTEGVNAVKVVARRTEDSLGGPLDLLFAPIVGVADIDLAAQAIAMVGGGTGAGLITLNEEDDTTFWMTGTVTLNVMDESNPHLDGAIQINSSDPDALKRSGIKNQLLAGEINVVAELEDTTEYDGVPVYDEQPLIVDPLKDLQPPANWGSTLTQDSNSLLPGYYPEGITLTSGDLELASGIYVLGGVGLNITGGNLTAEGVMFYIVDTGGVKLTGNGIVTITAYESEPYEGMAIWQEAGNTTEAQIVGTEQFTGIDGTLYLPDAHIDLGGTSDNFAIRQMIVDSIKIHGTGAMTINYDGRNYAPGTQVFLVE